MTEPVGTEVGLGAREESGENVLNGGSKSELVESSKGLKEYELELDESTEEAVTDSLSREEDDITVGLAATQAISPDLPDEPALDVSGDKTIADADKIKAAADTIVTSTVSGTAINDVDESSAAGTTVTDNVDVLDAGPSIVSPAPPAPSDAALSTTPPRKSSTPWANYLKRAVANVEQTLDKVLESSSEFDLSDSTPEMNAPPTRSSIESIPVPVLAPSPLPSAPVTSGRLSMQERLAMAIRKQNSASPSLNQTSNPRGSSRDSSLNRNTSISATPLDKSPAIPSPSPASSRLSSPRTSIDVNLESSTSTRPSTSKISSSPSSDLDLALSTLHHIIDSANEKGVDFGSSLQSLKEQLENEDRQRAEEVLQAQEKIDSLETKLKYLAQMEAERASAAKKRAGSSNEKMIAERDERIALLLEEGQRLSKQELKHMNTIKRLRAKERENEKLVNDARWNQERAERDMADYKERLKKAADIERRQTEKVKSLSKLESELDSLRKENAVQKVTISELNNELVLMEKSNNEAIIKEQTSELMAEKAHSKELQAELDKAHLDMNVSKEKFQGTIAELDARIQREVETSNQRQMELGEEIKVSKSVNEGLNLSNKSLEAKVEMYRSRSEEISSGQSSESHPTLLRQIETLQAQHAVASENWQGIEVSLLSRISTLEKDLEEYKSQERYSHKRIKQLVSETAMDYFSCYLTQNESLKEKSEQIEILQEQLQDVETTNNNHLSRVESLKDELQQAYVRTKELNQTLEQQRQQYEDRLATLREELKKSNENPPNVVSDRKKSINLSYDPLGVGVRTPTSSKSFIEDPSLSRGSLSGSRRNSSRSNWFQGSPFSPPPADYSEPILERSASQTSLENIIDTSDDSQSFGENGGGLVMQGSSSRGGGKHDNASMSTVGAGPSIQLVGRMGSTIRRLESELSAVKYELSKTKEVKEDACNEVVRLVKENDDLIAYKTKVDEQAQKIALMEERERTTLDLLGEKSEAVEELRADVDDVKAMYRQQIEDLVDRLNKYEAK